MKRTHILCVALACGLLAASVPAFAQEAAAPASVPENWVNGETTLVLLGRDDVQSSKFEEYRNVPKGVSMPLFGVQGEYGGLGYSLWGQNVSSTDQRYIGAADAGWFGMRFDYNQIPHQMGNYGRVFHHESAEGVWRMSGTLRKALGDAVDATPTAGRTYPFYVDLMAPTLASTQYVDLTSQRNRGNLEFALGKDTPFDVRLTYMRETKTGARGASGGTAYGAVQALVDVPEVLNELTQDYGLRAAWNFKMGDVHVSFNRNIYNDRVDAQIIDNPFRATDLAYTSAAVPGGPASIRIGTPPDNDANRIAGGFLFKLPLQTRISGDVAMSKWSQDAAFLPFTINSAIFTPAGVAANSLSALPRPSMDGQIDTSYVNLGFMSRPIPGIVLRAYYRGYDLEHKSTPIVWTGAVAASPDRAWGNVTPSAADPYGFVNANPYDNNTKRYGAQVSWEIKDIVLEGAYKHGKLERTYREATSGDENAYSAAAVWHTWDWLSFRGVVEQYKRSAKGWNPATSVGLQSDEAEKKTNRAGVDLDLEVLPNLGVSFAYFRKHDDYPNRPRRVASVPGTESGLLNWDYDEYTIEADYTVMEKAELGGYYTYEKSAQTNRWNTLTSGALNNSLNYYGTDEGNTFGAYALIHVVPEKWTFTFRASQAKVDGLMDITAREAGSFYTPGRTTLIPPGQGGAADITDFDDTKWTTILGELAYTVAKNVTFAAGYAYDKYTVADAYHNLETSLMPQSVDFYMQENVNDYKVNIVYGRLTYRF